MNTAIFSGSFNPIHKGHLAIAEYICRTTTIDQVWFLVSPHNPLKQADDLLPEEVRLRWVEKTIRDYPSFRASDFEFSLSRPSYTVDTLRALRTAYPDRQFSLIIGGDNWAVIDRWKEYDRLLSEFPLWVYPRECQQIIVPECYRSTVSVVHAPLLNVSSTLIRQRIAQGKSQSIESYLPECIADEVIDYMENNL